jgi:hypothetical protein
MTYLSLKWLNIIKSYLHSSMSDSSDTLESFYIQAIAGKLHNNTLKVTTLSVIAIPNLNKHSNHERSPNLQSVTENRDSIETNDPKKLPTS